MSTKTSFKRIAVVAAAALALGGISSVSANAALGQADTLTASATASSTTYGTAVDLVVTQSFIASGNTDTASYTVKLTSAPATSGVLPTTADTGTAASTAAGVLTVNAAVSGLVTTAAAAGRATGISKVSLSPDVAGTYVVTLTPATGLSAAALTWTVTATAPVVKNVTAFISASTGAAVTADDTATSLVGSGTAASAAKARITVKQYSTTDTATLMDAKYTSAVSVAVTGAGSVGTADNSTTRGATASTLAGTSSVQVPATQDFYLFADGRTGTSTVTITVGSTVITKTFVFSGSVKSLKHDVTNFTPKTYIGVGDSDNQIVFLGYDSNGNLVGTPTAADYGISSNTAVATVTVVDGVATVVGVAPGTATITVCNTASCTAADYSATTTVTVTKTSVAKVALSFDKDTYGPGEKMILTVSALDADGNPTADGTRDVYGTIPTSNVAVGGTAPTFLAAGEVLAGGKKTYTFYAPAAGVVTFTGTDSTAAANTITASATVTNAAADAAQAAIDAAQEATDAANAAYDAANNAMDSADAATAAAQDASDNAAAALAAVTSLSATVAKLVKSVAAIAAALAKIQKKLKA